MSQLYTTTTSSFTPRWNDRGSGASRDGGFWHPSPQGDMRPLGSVAVSHYNDINGNNIARLYGPTTSSSADAASTSGPGPVASPIGYTEIWKDEKSRAAKDGSFWRPIPPNGYVALGDVAQSGWSAPNYKDVWCVRQDIVKQGSFGSNSVWDDKKSGAKSDVSIWEVRGSSVLAAGGDEAVDGEAAATYLGPIRGSQNYDAPDSSFAQVPLA
ncbi:hypothetical protein ACHAPX_005873 [Trichoderma viride]|jgi:hypothetical protein